MNMVRWSSPPLRRQLSGGENGNEGEIIPQLSSGHYPDASVYPLARTEKFFRDRNPPRPSIATTSTISSNTSALSSIPTSPTSPSDSVTKIVAPNSRYGVDQTIWMVSYIHLSNVFVSSL
jgi:hypothetical protein